MKFSRRALTRKAKSPSGAIRAVGRHDKSDVFSLLKRGVLHSDNLSKAQNQKDQFSSVFSREDRTNVHHLYNPVDPSITGLSISQDGDKNLLRNVRACKALGPGPVPCRFIKEPALELLPILTTIFQQFVQDSEVSSDWKRVDVVPVFKKPAKDLMGNYQPFSLICVCCKILEQIISSHSTTLDQHELLSKFYHGFRKSFLCEILLFVTLRDLLSFRDKHIQIDIAELDFSKAFDTVPHRRL